MNQHTARAKRPGGMRWVSGASGPRYLAAESGPVRVAFTSRHTGASRTPYESLNLALHVGDEPARVLGNREAVAEALGFGPDAWTCAEQVHGSDVAVIEPPDVGMGARTLSPIAGDALVTSSSEALLAVLVADCVPVVLAEPETGVVGVAHAGWRGVLGGVVPNALDAMAGALGAAPDRIEVWIGPHIRSCCYQVEEARAWLFKAAFGERAGVGDRIDLEACLVMQLEQEGVERSRIHAVGLCTSCDPETFFSFRGADDGVTGRQAGLVSIGL